MTNAMKYGLLTFLFTKGEGTGPIVCYLTTSSWAGGHCYVTHFCVALLRTFETKFHLDEGTFLFIWEEPQGSVNKTTTALFMHVVSLSMPLKPWPRTMSRQRTVQASLSVKRVEKTCVMPYVLAALNRVLGGGSSSAREKVSCHWLTLPQWESSWLNK
jgi:hypothetical protein